MCYFKRTICFCRTTAGHAENGKRIEMKLLFIGKLLRPHQNRRCEFISCKPKLITVETEMKSTLSTENQCLKFLSVHIILFM
jgi:hypothetical protein